MNYDATAIEFMLHDQEEMKAMAVYTAQLIREGVTFSMSKDNIAVQVKLTGGF